MQTIGKTDDGKSTILIVASDELAEFRQAIARLAAIRGIVAGASVAELVEFPEADPKVVREVARGPIKPSRPSVRQPVASKKRLCQDCKKVEIPHNAKRCERCRKEEARRYAAERYRKAHPGATSRPIIKVSTPPATSGAPVDRVKLIREANERVSARLAK